MNNQSGTVLSTIDRLVGQFNLLNTMVDFIVTKIIPQTIAKACHSYHYCGSTRGSYCEYYHCEDDCKKIKHYHENIKYDNTYPFTCTDFKTCEEVGVCDWWEWDGTLCPAPC